MQVKTKQLLSLLVVSGVLVVPMAAGAINGGFNTNIGASESGLPTTNFKDVLLNIVKYASLILTILGVIGFLISGIIYITAGGASKAEAAQKWLTYSIVGVIVGLLGYIVIRLIAALLGVSGVDQ